ncbi:hypothetical protein BELL_0414g00050 [Botrytis elliptica]|uniref:Uncharacterized protein n=1 Tax=Botrytis elliptica TaxID=278938 RepID=A0A4Z1JUE0_9HELO|nr:hypothetical protein EAE99_006876 [Botrytis elliptica]TGO72833.1 hypothetical protein BELL_0414g00050 [Botrytis elliptica]
MSTLGRRSQKGESSKSAYTSAYHSFGEGQEEWQDNLRERSAWGETAGQDVSEDATSRKKKEEKEELGKSQDVPAHEEVSTEEGSPVTTPDPLTEVSESTESDGRIKDARAEESRREREEIARAKKGKGREITDEIKAREIEEKLNRNAAQKARFDVRGLGAPSGAADIPDPRPPPGARPGTAEKKFYVYKEPHKVSYIKPWTWRFRRAKSADESGNVAGEGHYYVHKRRPKPAPSWLFWKWNWQGPKPISWIPIYPSHHPENDDPELKIFIAYSCGHRFPTRVISAPTWTASSPSFLFSPSSPWTPNTPTYPRSESTSGHPHIRPLPSLRVETLRVAARNEGIKNIISPENYECPNCHIWRHWFGGLCLLAIFWAVFTWYFAFVWPYTWWATTQNGDPIPRYTMIAKFDIHREGDEFHVRQAIGGLVIAMFLFFVRNLWMPVTLILLASFLLYRLKKARPIDGVCQSG